jgi:predicted TIM-barrel fold metal-dependent hydrolase
MLIVDAQVHIWSGHKPANPNHRQVESFSADELLREMDEGGVHAALIHPPTSWDPDAGALALDAARRHPDRLAILGNFPLDRPESRTWPTDGTIDWLWPAAERAGVPIALLASHFLGKVGEVAERHPGLKLIIDHLGRPGGSGPGASWDNLAEMLALAKHPNVAVKATGAPGYSREPYPFRDLHGYIRQIVEAFGARRVFWGTDITRMPCPWRQCVTMYTEELPWLSAADKELIMGRAVCEWLGWKLPAR